MKNDIIRQIIQLVVQAQTLATKIGIPNILQPGLIKEMIIAQILDHEIIHSKRDADACDPVNRSLKFEYLSCLEGGSGQIDRMFKEPEEKRLESLKRIRRNHRVFLAVFYKTAPLVVKTIYELTTEVIIAETERQLDRSENNIAHVGFSEVWAEKNGKIVFQSA